MATGIQIQHRRATAAVWATSPKVLAVGELGITTDSHIIKIGDGVNVWADLDVALEGAFLGVTGKAADSELLDGIEAAGFLLTGDATTAATANKVAKRTSDGKLKAVDGTASDDVTTFSQMNAAIVVGKTETLRSVSDAVTSTTLASTDVGKMVVIANSSTTQQRPVVIPTNAVDPIPVGSWIDVCSSDAGNLKIDVTNGVTVLGGIFIFGGFSIVRFMKNATNSWIAFHLSNNRAVKLPRIRVYKSTGTTAWAANVDKALDFNTIDTAQTFNPDEEWFGIPAAGLATDKRILIKKDGLYSVTANWNGTTFNQNYLKICKMSGTAVVGNALIIVPVFGYGGVTLPAYRFAANESVGAVFLTLGATDTGKADTAGAPHDLSITRLSD